MKSIARIIAAVVGVALAFVVQAADETMPREKVDTIVRPMFNKGCQSAAVKDNSIKSLSGLQLESYCNCVYDEVTRGMDGRQVMRFFMDAGLAKQKGEDTSALEDRVLVAGLSCIQNQMSTNKDASLGALFKEQCVAGFKDDPDLAINDGKVGAATVNDYCGCMIDRVTADKSSAEGLRDLRLLARLGKSKSVDGLDPDDRDRIAFMAMECMGGSAGK